MKKNICFTLLICIPILTMPEHIFSNYTQLGYSSHYSDPIDGKILLLGIAAVFGLKIAYHAFIDNNSHLKKELETKKNNIEIPILEITGNINGCQLLKSVQRINKSSAPGLLIFMDSWGGEAAVSKAIFDELLQFKKEGRPIIVFVQNQCLSAAYLISSVADQIICNEFSSIGSIGVYCNISSIHNVTYKRNELQGDYNPMILSSGKYKLLHHVLHELSQEEKSLVQTACDEIYRGFCDIVAQARNLSVDDHTIWADGKEFTGKQALNIGLVDSFGSYSDARQAVLEHIQIKHPTCDSITFKPAE